MQDLIETLFCGSPEIPSAIAQFCAGQPDFVTAEREYEVIASKIQELVGFELFDEFETRLWDYVSLQVNAYYRFGLGLREAVARQLTL